MPSPSYAQNKKSIYNWRDSPDNRERQRIIDHRSYLKNVEWRKIKTVFLHILLI